MRVTQTKLIYDGTPRYVHLRALNESRSTGKERDTESGLDYFGARYYGLSMGRFMSPILTVVKLIIRRLLIGTLTQLTVR